MRELWVVDLAHHLVVFDCLAQQFLHTMDESTVSSLGDELANYLVLVQKLLVEGQLAHLMRQPLHRVGQLLLLIVNLVWLETYR